MKLKTIFIFFFASMYLSGLHAQFLTGFSSQFDNDLSQWIIYPEDENLPECELRCRWKFQQDPTEWDFRMGEHSGTIRSKWKDKFDDWEIIGDNQITRLRMVWPRDPRQWRIESGDKEYTISMKYNHPGSDWEVYEGNQLILKCSEVYQNDIRDWALDDNLPEDLHFNAKLAMVFAVIFTNLVSAP